MGAIRRFDRRLESLVLVAFLALGLVANGCSPSEDERPSSDTGVRRGGTLVYASTQRLSGFNQLNPTSARLLLANVMSRVWPSAFSTEADGKRSLNRDLVESAEVTNTNPQTVVYRLDPRAVWSDGDPIDARDFIYLWRTAYTPNAKDIDGSDVAASTASVRGVIQSVTGSDGDRTVNVVFARPFADWRSLFSFLVPSHIAERVGWNHGFDAFDPAVMVSGGPFRVGSHRPDEDVTLVRNERYWGTPATLDSIVVRFLPDGNQLLAAIKNRELDLAELINPDVDAVTQARAVPGLVTVVNRQSRYTRLYFNLRNPLLAVPEVRRAVALAVDRPGILARSTGQLDREKATIINNRLYTPGEAGYRDLSGGRYDRPDTAAARRLLEGAAFRRGGDGIYERGDQRLSFRMPGGGPLNALLQLIQAQLRDAGVEIRIGAPIDSIASGDFDIALNSRGTGLPEVGAQFSTAGGFNPGKYSNSAVDELIRAADSELDDGRRHDLHARVEEILWADMPTLPLEQVLGVVVHRDSVANVVPHATGAIFWNAEKWGLRSPS
jgi:peptide/nickel transport system substrate-binding protein